MNEAQHYEFLARLQNPFPLYYSKLGQWHYIFDNPMTIDSLQHWHQQYHQYDFARFVQRCRNEYTYHGIARGKTELNAWRNACQNLSDMNQK